MVTIPRNRAEVEKRFDNRRGYMAALNVKVYGMNGWDNDKVREHFKCSDADAERAAEFVWESAQEQFWQREAQDCLNGVMYGPERASDFEPCGTFKPEYEVLSDGRSAGWLVVPSLGDPREWDARRLQQWRKFARIIRESIAYLTGWDYARDAIEANRWAEPGSEAYNFRDKDGKTTCLVDEKALAAAAPELRDMLDDVLHTCELNMDDMEPETLATCDRARALLERLPKREG